MITRRTLLGMGALAGTSLLAGCAGARGGSGGADGQQTTTAAEATDSSTTDVQSDAVPEAPASGVLVAFFSRAGENYAGGGTEVIEVGHTKVMAGYIAEALGADTYEIAPAEPYPDGYDACCDVGLEEQAADARPAIANPLPDLSAYGTVFVGCPIWWGDEPMIVRTFLEGVDLSGKTVVPFTTHGGSGLGSVPQSLAQRATGAEVLDGLAIVGTAVDDARDEVVAWATGLGLA